MSTSRIHNTHLVLSTYRSPIGSMKIVSYNEGVYLLEFSDRKNLDKQLTNLEKWMKSSIVEGTTKPAVQLKDELDLYFKGKLTSFKTNVHLLGSPFQIKVLKELQNIPFGKTISYLEQATGMGQRQAVRAVASANGKNPLAIILPCHRVVSSNGGLGGYAGGIEKKKWLLAHEKNFFLP